MSKKSEKAKEFLNKLENDPEMQMRIKQGIEKLAKDNGYELTEEELEQELRERWQCRASGGGMYSEPPGF